MESIAQDSTVAIDGHWQRLLSSPTYTRVEQRVIRQLIQGLLFEAVVPAVESSATEPGGLRVWTIPGRAGSGETVSYHCTGTCTSSFGRIRLVASPVMRQAPDDSLRSATLGEFFTEVMVDVVPSDRLPALMDELHQTLLKDVQSQTLRGMPTSPDLDWTHDEWEGVLQEGHPYHPSYKSRLGFTLDDNVRYGPEFQRDIHPVWLAIARDEGFESASDSIQVGGFLRKELGEPTWQRFRKAIVDAGKCPQHYMLLPVHPWQWLHRVLPSFHGELAAGRILYLGQSEDAFRAQQSIRTLSNAVDPAKAHVKLSLGITNTSTSRILAAHTVRNSARISDWLHGLVSRDTDAQRMGLVILREVLGVTYDYAGLAEARQTQAYGSLGAVWRESPHRYLNRYERAMAFNGLTQVAGSGAPMIDGWIRQYGVVPWTRQLLSVSVTPLIHMLYAHGIGLESHGQNILLIHRNGWPERIALKDFHDGVRFSMDLLREPERAPALVPEPASHAAVNRNSYIHTTSADEVRDFTYDAFFFIALTELCLCLEQHYALDEADFWAMAAEAILSYQAMHPELAERFSLFDLFAERIEIEELTKRRLFGDAERRFMTRENPLHRHGSPGC